MYCKTKIIKIHVAMHFYATVNICVHGFLYDWLNVSRTVQCFPLLYGQCRSINNATLAEVKEACVSGGSVEGEEERDSGRQRE